MCDGFSSYFICKSLGKLQNNSLPLSVILTDSDASTPQSPNCITAIIWKHAFGFNIVLSPLEIFKVCSPQSGGYPIPIEYPVLDSYLI